MLLISSWSASIFPQSSMFFLFEEESCDFESRSIILILVFSSQSLLISFLSQNAQFSAFLRSYFCFLLSALQSFNISQSSSSLLLSNVLNGFTLLSKCFYDLVLQHYLNIACSLLQSYYIAMLAAFPSSKTTFTKSPFGVTCFLVGLLCQRLMPFQDQKSVIRASSTWIPFEMLVRTQSILLFQQKCSKNYRTQREFIVWSFEFEFIQRLKFYNQIFQKQAHLPKIKLQQSRRASIQEENFIGNKAQKEIIVIFIEYINLCPFL